MIKLRFRNRYLVLADVILLGSAAYALFALRFESFAIPIEQARTALAFISVAIPCQIAILIGLGLYRRLWRFASVRELEHILLAGFIASGPTVYLGLLGLAQLGLTRSRVPLSVLIPYSVLSIGIIAFPRFLIRYSGWRAQIRRKNASDRRVLIVGAGAAGEMIAREFVRNRTLRMSPVAFVDDDLSKQRLTLAGIPIAGALRDIPTVVSRLGIGEIVIAMPSAPGSVIRNVIKEANTAGVETKIVPGLSNLLTDGASVKAIREVRIDDLLRREPVHTEPPLEAGFASGTVMVTGAGGSIGSELCRQLLSLEPQRLVLVGHGENPIFHIVNELKPRAGKTQIIPLIADVRMEDRVREIVARYRPNMVFHAAAHKHVPLMEANPAEAITNNVLGTRNLVEACVEFEVDRFVMISTDKAVRPTNVMGASKRVAEYVVQNAARRHDVNFVSVRFGNVLGSQGSVVPTFTRQIREGGPVTVTHPEMRRYFMTIPEAVQLVLQAGAQGQGGELFMLDMGEPVKIVDLARDMIRLSGLEEGEDVSIEFSGVRPGEKLYEEMFFSHEVAEPTAHPKILRARAGTLEIASDEQIDELIRTAQRSAPTSEIRRLLRGLVPDYTPDSAGHPADDPESMHEPDPSRGRGTNPDNHAFNLSSGTPPDADAVAPGTSARAEG